MEGGILWRKDGVDFMYDRLRMIPFSLGIHYFHFTEVKRLNIVKFFFFFLLVFGH